MVDETSLRVCPECDSRYESAREGDRCDRDGSALLSELAMGLLEECPALGRVIGDKYVVVGMLGKGGFGAVYRAIQLPVRRPVALKLIRAAGDDDGQRRSRFYREARLVAKMSDPASVTLHDYGEDEDGTVYMAFELIDGATLEAVIAGGPMPAARVAPLLVQVLRALAEAHRMGVLHRDLKPGNVMIQADALGGESARVLDFGIAKSYIRSSFTSLSDLTTEDVVVGTPRYMAPEQARNLPLDQRTDLYATGVMAYAMLTGRPPFDGNNAMNVLMRHLQEAPPPMPEGLEVPEKLQAVVLKAMSKAPDDRFQSAEEMVRALADAIPGLGVSSTGMSPVSKLTAPLQAFDDTVDGPGLTSSAVIAAESVPQDPPSRGRGGVLVAAIAIVGVVTWPLLPTSAPLPLNAPAAAAGPADAAAAVVGDAAVPVDAAKPPDARQPKDATRAKDAAARREPRRPDKPKEVVKPPVKRDVPKPDKPAGPAKPDKPRTLEVPEF